MAGADAAGGVVVGGGPGPNSNIMNNSSNTGGHNTSSNNTLNRSSNGGGNDNGGGGVRTSNAAGGSTGGGTLNQQQSAAGGGGVRTPPTTPLKAGGKMLAVKILMLDDTYTLFQIQSKAHGAVLLEQVCRQLNLLESDYFGLEYTDGSTCYWLDLDKPMSRQVCLRLAEPLLRFCVKFYTPDPGQLEEEYTRYLVALQIKRDLAHGSLVCNNSNTAALLASYIVQAECGDYVEEDYPDHRYLSMYKFVPSQDDHLEMKIMESHKKHVGMTPGAADLNLLETARRCDMYGIKMHQAKDHESVALNLAVAHMGVLVFQNHTKINTFSWAKVRKLSFKRKRFLIKLHPDGYGEGNYKDVVEFFFDGRNECKNFWKKCVEHHGFFRCMTVKKLPRQKTRVISRGSSFRYSGRTQKQVQDYVRENYVKRQPFQRSQSFRHSPCVPGVSVGGVNMSRSAQTIVAQTPLLQDNMCVGTPVSLSCGSVTLASTADAPPSPTSPSSPPHLQQHHHMHHHHLHHGGGDASPPSRQDTLSPSPSSVPCSPDHRQHLQQQQPASPDGLYSAEYRQQQQREGQQRALGTPTPFLQLQQQQQPKTPHKVHYQSDQQPSYSPTSKGHDDSPPSGNGVKQPQHSPQLYTPPTPPTPYNTSSSSGAPPAVPPHHYTPSAKEGSHTTNNIPNGSHSVHYADDVTGGDAPPSPPLPLSPAHEGEGAELTGRGAGGRRKQPAERAYFIAKELLTTERTYGKDLDVINGHFRRSWEGLVSSLDESDEGEEALCPAVPQLLRLLTPIVEAHTGFLATLENRLANWDGRGGSSSSANSSRSDTTSQKVADLFEQLLDALPLYDAYLAQHQNVLEGLQGAIKRNRRFETLYRSFEGEKVCYLPFSAFVLKPLYRLHHYVTILEFLCSHYGSTGHPELREVISAKSKLSQAVTNGQQHLLAAAQFVKLVEVERDLVGLENLVQPGRTFIREGCLQKLSRKGYQQRMFFLFNDVLLYTNRTSAPSLQFKVHGQLPLRGVMVEETESRMGAAHCFTIYGGNRALMVAANTAQEKQRWLNDLTAAITLSKTRPDHAMAYLSLKSISASDEVLDHSSITGGGGDGDGAGGEVAAARKGAGVQPSNSSVHVCWHRATSVHYTDYIRAAQNQLSGYLLRKFKNSMGWQKLWVVFTNFCLFFYKTFQDDAPLASLPLLGYTVSAPAPHDMINKEYVFKLQFKNHVYFFRAESEYTFSRWLDVISSATQGGSIGAITSPTPSADVSSPGPPHQTVQI